MNEKTILSNERRNACHDAQTKRLFSVDYLFAKKKYTLNHLIERIKIYNEEKFNYEIIQENLKENG